MSGIGATWSRHAVGYRQGELEGGDGVAATVVAVIGGPALIVGSQLATSGGISIGQLLIIGPLAALAGGVLLGGAANMASHTGVAGTWLLRPAFGRVGAVVISVLRLVMVGIWAVVGLQLAGGWASAAADGAGMEVSPGLMMGLVALLGVGLAGMGLVRTTQVVVRRPLFVASVFLVALLMWQLVEQGSALASVGSGSFWDGLQQAIEVSVVFVPFVQSVGRRLRSETDAVGGIGVGYAVPAIVMFMIGALVGASAGGLPVDLFAFDAATGAFAVAAAWVLIAEVDQAYESFVAAGYEAVGIIPGGPTVIIGGVTVAAVVATAIFLGSVPLGLAYLAASLVLPAVVISVLDFHFARGRHYPDVDLHGYQGSGGMVNVVGMGCWLGAVVLGQALDPVGPEEWVSTWEAVRVGSDLPWRLLMATLGGSAYLVLVRWREHRASVYDLRGV